MSLTDAIKTLVDEDTAAQFRRRATRAGCSASELLRDVVYQVVHGVTWGEHVAEHRRKAIEVLGPNAEQYRSASGPIPFDVGGRR